MKSLSSPRIARGLLLLACLAAGAAQADTVIFGSRLLEVPAPAGYEPLSTRAPRFVEISAGYLPAGNRLVEAYASTADAARLAAGEAVDIKQYFQLQTLRSVDGTPVPADAFGEIAKSIEGEIDALITNANAQGEALSKQGNAAAQQSTGTNPDVEVGNMKSLGKFRREPWGVFFTTRAVVTVGGKPVPTTGSAAIVLANQQLMYLYAYSYAEPDAPNGKAWTERAVSDWADAVYAANGGTVADTKPAVAAAVAAADERGAPSPAADGPGGGKNSNLAVIIALGAVFAGLAVVFIGLAKRKRPA